MHKMHNFSHTCSHVKSGVGVSSTKRISGEPIGYACVRWWARLCFVVWGWGIGYACWMETWMWTGAGLVLMEGQSLGININTQASRIFWYWQLRVYWFRILNWYREVLFELFRSQFGWANLRSDLPSYLMFTFLPVPWVSGDGR